MPGHAGQTVPRTLPERRLTAGSDPRRLPQTTEYPPGRPTPQGTQSPEGHVMRILAASRLSDRAAGGPRPATSRVTTPLPWVPPSGPPSAITWSLPSRVFLGETSHFVRALPQWF